LTNKWVPKLT